MLFSHVQRTRVCKTTASSFGLEGRHATPPHHERSSLQAAGGSCLAVLIMLIQGQLTHSVRVPALSAKREGNPYAHL